MRAYQITLKATDDRAAQTCYAGTQSEATAAKKAYLESAGLRPQADAAQVAVEQVEIPTDKGGLIPFLNKLVG